MPAYFVCTMTVHDPETYRRYTARTPAILARHGGRFLTRGDACTTAEGEAFTERMVLLEFPDRAAAEAFYNDPEYQEVSAFRRAASKGRMVLQEGRGETAAPDPRL
ncbi:DUF1330 domain-containing protein [Paracoccus sp. S-4012]|uniref:DUF1330 domain-containing protein n=1 Tax=Paracoccus sp. S-4012 TaxID=2665648 RepID=UPI0012AFBDA9|nr:DUF1330 domain-containing protein [Paracoccus sp. S-4012]MRX50018.1 DUF1330 domain-containing protein [Paracoccus sp. S-4012]